MKAVTLAKLIRLLFLEECRIMKKSGVILEQFRNEMSGLLKR
jgi:hypothetical protein